MSSPSREVRFVGFRRHLLKVFEERRQARPSYSFRAFARHLDVDPSSLRKIISGKRSLGEKLIHKFAEKLKMTESELTQFLASQIPE